MATDARTVPTWKKVLAAILDFLTVFFVVGYAIGAATGQLTENGFNLHGGPALLLFAIIIAYFIVCQRVLGGTLWQRILGATGR